MLYTHHSTENSYKSTVISQQIKAPINKCCFNNICMIVLEEQQLDRWRLESGRDDTWQNNIRKHDEQTSIFNELRYPWSNLSEILIQIISQPRFKTISKIFLELSQGQAWSDGRTDRQTERQTDTHTHKTDGRTVRQTDTGNDNNPALVPGGNKNSNRYGTTVNPTGSTAKCVAIAMNPIALSSVTISEYNARILYHGFCMSGTWNIHQQCTLFNKEY